MKAVATLFVLVLASCAVSNDPDTSSVEEHATTRVLPQVNTSCQWTARGTCYGLPNDGNNIWPAGMGITSVQVLLRAGPDRLEHKQQTFLAFVIWNSTAVGRIFRIDLGSSDAADWRANLDGIVAGRTFNIFDSQAGSAGSTVGGPGPIPHPNIDDLLQFTSPYLDVVRRQATIINDATTTFLSTRAVGID
jgi:hypothetical protein